MTHKHDVYFSPYSTEAHNLVMQIADYCNKRGIWYKISESTLGIGIEYGGNVAYVIDTDRKTEPQTEDKHAVCTGCDYYDLPNAFHPCASCVDFSKYKPKIEAEPRTEEPSFTATDFGKGTITRYTDEPQTDCSWK